MATRTMAPSGVVTFLFTDIEGSSPAWDRYGTAMAMAQRRHDDILRRAIADSNGYVFATGGDGVAAAFARPERALATALAVQRAMRSEPWPEPLAIRVRMGMHTGEALERDGNYFGPAVIRAARLMALVDGGRVVCSRATRDAVQDGLPAGTTLLSVGSVSLKGLSTPEEVFAVSAPGLDEAGQAVGTPPRVAWTAPRPLNRLIGRHDEIDEVVGLLRTSWLVTITGIGGVGKSRLASTVAERMLPKFPDGVVWVELAPLADDSDVVQAAADVLQVHAQLGQALSDTVTAALDGRRVLIVLDNCEHVRKGVANLATSIGQRCRDVVVLASSRERLGVDGERIAALAPLRADGSASPALELLRDRIDDAHADPADDAALVEIAERLDGLPLALELAAARCRSLGPADVAARLRREFDVLADRARAVERHRTLDQALQWSYHLLNDHERAVFEHVSLFAGGFDLLGAEEVVGDRLARVDVDDALASLVDKSLVQRRGRSFRLLETTRQFAGDRLDSSGQRLPAEQCHAAYIVDQVRRIHDGLHGPDEAASVAALDSAWPDVRTVMRRALAADDPVTAITLATHLALEALWRRPEALSWIRAAVDRFGDRPGPHRHELLGAGGVAAWVLADVPAAIALAERALAVDPAPGTALDCLPEGAAIGAYNFSGLFDRAARVCRRALDVLASGHDRWTEAVMWSNLALSLAIGPATSDDALDAAAGAIEMAARTANPTSLGVAHFSKAACLFARDAVTAAGSCERALAYADEVRNQWLIGVTAVIAASAIAANGEPEEALPSILAAADELQRTGWTTHAWSAAWGAVPLLWDLGRLEHAALLTGGCAQSGVANVGSNTLPSEIASLARHDGLDRLVALYDWGGQQSLPQLLRVVTGQDPLPDTGRQL